MTGKLAWSGPAVAALLTTRSSTLRDRRERRTSVVRLVEYAPLPRVHADHVVAMGFTRDVSESGMCLSVQWPAATGSLLRVTLHAIDGRAERMAIARVLRCERDATGRHWLGLDLLRADAALEPLPARPPLRTAASRGSSGRIAVA